MRVKEQQLELDMEQLSGSKLGRVYNKAVYRHPACLTSMQSTSCEMLGWMKHIQHLYMFRDIIIGVKRQVTI